MYDAIKAALAAIAVVEAQLLSGCKDDLELCCYQQLEEKLKKLKRVQRAWNEFNFLLRGKKEEEEGRRGVAVLANGY